MCARVCERVGYDMCVHVQVDMSIDDYRGYRKY